MCASSSLPCLSKTLPRCNRACPNKNRPDYNKWSISNVYPKNTISYFIRSLLLTVILWLYILANCHCLEIPMLVLKVLLTRAKTMWQIKGVTSIIAHLVKDWVFFLYTKKVEGFYVMNYFRKKWEQVNKQSLVYKVNFEREKKIKV